MKSPSDAVDEYLADRFKIGLEQVLLDATGGCVTPQLVGAAVSDLARVHRWPYADGGAWERYEGLLRLNGIAYAFDADVFVDEDRARYLTQLNRFEPVEWTASLRVAGGADTGPGQ